MSKKVILKDRFFLKIFVVDEDSLRWKLLKKIKLRNFFKKLQSTGCECSSVSSKKCFTTVYMWERLTHQSLLLTWEQHDVELSEAFVLVSKNRLIEVMSGTMLFYCFSWRPRSCWRGKIYAKNYSFSMKQFRHKYLLNFAKSMSNF